MLSFRRLGLMVNTFGETSKLTFTDVSLCRGGFRLPRSKPLVIEIMVLFPRNVQFTQKTRPMQMDG